MYIYTLSDSYKEEKINVIFGRNEMDEYNIMININLHAQI